MHSGLKTLVVVILLVELVAVIAFALVVCMAPPIESPLPAPPGLHSSGDAPVGGAATDWLARGDDAASIEAGQQAAHADLAAGRLVIQTSLYDLSRQRAICARLLFNRYGVHLYRPPGVMNQQLADYIEGYNSVARPAIAARFGKNVLDECWQEAATRLTREDRLRSAELETGHRMDELVPVPSSQPGS